MRPTVGTITYGQGVSTSGGGSGGGSGGLYGAGTPETYVAASPGTTYWDTTNKVFYVKDTGTGTTGWRELIW